MKEVAAAAVVLECMVVKVDNNIQQDVVDHIHMHPTAWLVPMAAEDILVLPEDILANVMVVHLEDLSMMMRMMVVVDNEDNLGSGDHRDSTLGDDMHMLAVDVAADAVVEHIFHSHYWLHHPEVPLFAETELDCCRCCLPESLASSLVKAWTLDHDPQIPREEDGGHHHQEQQKLDQQRIPWASPH